MQNVPRERNLKCRMRIFRIFVLKVPLREHMGRPSRSGPNPVRRPALWANEVVLIIATGKLSVSDILQADGCADQGK